MRESTWGTPLVFALSGAVQSTWMSRLPVLWDRLGTGPAGLGAALVAFGIGIFASMLAAGRTWLRFGSRWTVLVSAVLASGLLVVIAHVSSLAQLIGVLFCFGLAVGAWDVAMNVQAAAVERRAGRTWMIQLHGWWSVGTVAGALAGVVMATAKVSLTAHFWPVAVIAAASCAIGALTFDADRPAESRPTPTAPIRRPVVLLAALVILGATIEGTASDWLAVYLRHTRQLSYTQAAIGYMAFVAAMAVGRFAAHRIEPSIGPSAIVRLGVLVAAIGAVIAVLARSTDLAYLGALGWGLGSSVVFPAALSAGGRATHSDSVVANLTLVGYSAGIGGPLVIGVLANQFGIQSALLMLVPTLAVAAVMLSSSVST